MRQETCTGSQEITVSANGQPTAGGHAGNGQWVCDHHLHKTVQVSGTFTGSVMVMGSVDGVNFVPVAGPLTAPGAVLVEHSLKALALQGTAWVSGSASGVYSYFNSRSDPG